MSSLASIGYSLQPRYQAICRYLRHPSVRWMRGIGCTCDPAGSTVGKGLGECRESRPTVALLVRQDRVRIESSAEDIWRSYTYSVQQGVLDRHTLRAGFSCPVGEGGDNCRDGDSPCHVAANRFSGRGPGCSHPVEFGWRPFSGRGARWAMRGATAALPIKEEGPSCMSRGGMAWCDTERRKRLNGP